MAKDDWRLCADWLVRCEILAPDHPVTQPQTEVYELAQILRDGVLLCHLLNKLHPGAVDPKDFSQRPQMCQFLCLKNIRVFLQTCQTVFLLKPTELFEPNDLFEVKDFGKVITALSRLSKCPEAHKIGIQGFSSSKKDYMNLMEFAKDFSEIRQGHTSAADSLYSGLKDIASDGGYNEDIYEGFQKDDKEEEDIYDDLMSLKGRQNSEAQKSPVTPRPKTKREHCITELVETERNYVDVLNMIIQHFIRPLSNILQQQDHAVMFRNIENLHNIHTGFHSDLSQACAENNRSNKCIPDCFIMWKEKFLIYGDFCSNLPLAQEKVDDLGKKSMNIQQAILDCQQKANEGKFRLRDLLSVPMQRVLKYHLLLKELIKNTDREHRERAALQKALEEMQDLSLYVNEVKRDNEALNLIKEIQGSIVDLQMPEGTSLKDYGRLLKDGELRIKKHPENRTKTRYIFLFDKVMLMCKSRGENYNYKDALILSQFKVEECKEKGFPFMLAEKSGAMAYTIYAKTEELKQRWMEAIRMAHENTSPSGAREGNHDFIMQSFDVPTICDVCRKLLRGVFYQGYKCQTTAMAVHKECISKARNMEGPPKVPPKTSGPPTVPPKTPNRKESIGGRSVSNKIIAKAKAKYTHQGNMHPQEGHKLLRFVVNDVIDVLNDSDKFWWEGRLNGEEGFFPAEYVEVRKIQRQEYEVAAPGKRTRKPSDSSPAAAFYNDPDHKHHRKEFESEFMLYPGFVGPNEMSRDDAAKRLENSASGTFLIRKSKNPNRPGNYALSIKYGQGSHSVKHIRIEESADKTKYYLADCKMFNSVPDLVDYYKTNSLLPSFPELDTTLLIPYKSASQPVGVLGFCTAQFDYAANQPNQLSLRLGDRIGIISKAGESRGWWKGQLNGRTGYFPCAYVEEDD